MYTHVCVCEQVIDSLLAARQKCFDGNEVVIRGTIAWYCGSFLPHHISGVVGKCSEPYATEVLLRDVDPIVTRAVVLAVGFNVAMAHARELQSKDDAEAFLWVHAASHLKSLGRARSCLQFLPFLP